MIDPPHRRHIDPDRMMAALMRPLSEEELATARAKTSILVPADVFVHRELTEEEADADRVLSTFVREFERVASKETP